MVIKILTKPGRLNEYGENFKNRKYKKVPNSSHRTEAIINALKNARELQYQIGETWEQVENSKTTQRTNQWTQRQGRGAPSQRGRKKKELKGSEDS